MEKKSIKILIADDNRQDAEILQQLFKDSGYFCLVVSNGLDAIESAIRENPDLILLDVDMPGENGYEVARQLKMHRATRMVPIIMLTAMAELNAKLEGIEAGVDDFLTKPYRPIELMARTRSLLRVKSLNDQLDDSESIVFTLARIIEAKDTHTLGHADRVSKFAVALGKLLKRPQEELEILETGGVLHDIGKMAVPDAILLKPGALTREEFETMKAHPVVGTTICERLRSAKSCLSLIRHHHEKLNGEGYPDHINKNEISVSVRITTIVDIFDALTSRRAYKDAWPIEKAFSVMFEEVKKGWWDGDILKVWEKFVKSAQYQTLLLKK